MCPIDKHDVYWYEKQLLKGCGYSHTKVKSSVAHFLARADEVPTVAIKLLESKKVKSRVALE